MNGAEVILKPLRLQELMYVLQMQDYGNAHRGGV